MGVFRASSQEQELDPAWQRRRRRLFALIGIGSVMAATVLILGPRLPPWGKHSTYSTGRPSPEMPVSPEAPPQGEPLHSVRPGAQNLQTDGLRAGAWQEIRAEKIAHKARQSLTRPGPWLTRWLDQWNRIGAPGSTAGDEFQAMLALWLAGDAVTALEWWPRLLQRVCDPQASGRADYDQLLHRVEVLDLLQSGLLETALGKLLQKADLEPLPAEEKLLVVILRRELAGADPGSGWLDDLIGLAADEGRVAALARTELMRLVHIGLLQAAPNRVLAQTGDPRLKAIAQARPVEPPGRPVETELMQWMLTRWRQDLQRDVDMPEHERTEALMSVYSLEWALESDEMVRDENSRTIMSWAKGLGRMEQVFLAEWMFHRGQLDHVTELLGPDREFAMSPLAVVLYTSAMQTLGREQELLDEFGQRAEGRWPEPLVLYWLVQDRLLKTQPDEAMVQSIMMRFGRGAVAMDPTWVFDMVPIAYQGDYRSVAGSLIAMASGSLATEERALGGMLNLVLREGRGDHALEVLDILRERREFPGPRHGMWLWFRLVIEDEPEAVLAEAMSWLDVVPDVMRSDALFVAAAAAYETGNKEQATRWLQQIHPNRLGVRFRPAYSLLMQLVGAPSATVMVGEQPRNQPTFHISREEDEWLNQRDPQKKRIRVEGPGERALAAKDAAEDLKEPESLPEQIDDESLQRALDATLGDRGRAEPVPEEVDDGESLQRAVEEALGDISRNPARE